jgi:hypothetical protein
MTRLRGRPRTSAAGEGSDMGNDVICSSHSKLWCNLLKLKGRDEGSQN